MARSYDVTKLSPVALQDATWARTVARQMARDIPNDGGAYPDYSFQDEEWDFWIDATKFVQPYDNTQIYYRPHVAVAFMMESNPSWSERIRIMMYMEYNRNVIEIAQAMRASGKWIDKAIYDTCGYWPELDSELKASF